MSPDRNGIGARVRAVRERRGLSREALAVHSGLSWSAVTQVETGRRTNLRPQTLSALSGALGVTVDYLVRGGVPQATLLDHHAFLYGSEEEFVGTAGPFLADGLSRGEPVLAVTSPRNIALLRDELGRAGKSVRFADATTWYTSPAAALGEYKHFVDTQVASGASWVRIVGEPVWAARSAPEVRRWTAYESVLNLTFACSAVTVVCPYDKRSLPSNIVAQARQTHPHIVDANGITASSDYADPCALVLAD